MKITTLEVAGIRTAMFGMRNPKNSWDRSDSRFDNNTFVIGEADLKLAQNLIRGGNEHCKFMRQIYVGVNMEMPRYFWSEMDTYHHNTKNSCSTMHKLLQKDGEIELDDFEYDVNDDAERNQLESVIEYLNELGREYYSGNGRPKNVVLRKAKKLLPESYLQLRTISTNYAEIRNIYIQRVLHPHRLKEEWVDEFGTWVESLPYAKELILYGLEKK